MSEPHHWGYDSPHDVVVEELRKLEAQVKRLTQEWDDLRGLIEGQGGPMQMFPCQTCGKEWPWPGVLSSGMSTCPPCLRRERDEQKRIVASITAVDVAGLRAAWKEAQAERDEAHRQLGVQETRLCCVDCGRALTGVHYGAGAGDGQKFRCERCHNLMERVEKLVKLVREAICSDHRDKAADEACVDDGCNWARAALREWVG